MLAAPAITPVVVVATAVAFPGQPKMVVARVAASLLTAVVMGWAWSRWGRPEWITRRLPAHRPHNPATGSEGAAFFGGGRPTTPLLPRRCTSGPRCHGDGRVGGDAGRVLGGRRVRGVQPDHGPDGAETRFPGGGARRGRQAVGDAVRHVRPGVRCALRACHAGGGRLRRDRGRPGPTGWLTVTRETENTVMRLVWLSSGLITITGAFTRYVKPSLLPWLAITAT